jgi:anaerobic selenocysteine-containing dehydrogenase
MDASRRDFLKVTTLAGAAAVVFGFGPIPAFASAHLVRMAEKLKTSLLK